MIIFLSLIQCIILIDILHIGQCLGRNIVAFRRIFACRRVTLCVIEILITIENGSFFCIVIATTIVMIIITGRVVTELLKSRLGEDAAKAKRGIAVGFMFPEQRDCALALAAKLRGEGESVALSLKAQKPKKFFSRAESSGAAKAVFLGPDDVEKGVARMKNMETREEAEICLSEAK